MDSTRQQPSAPSLETIHTKRVPTLKYVPKQLRSLWAQCLSRGLASATYHNDVSQWGEQQMLVKCVLCAPLRAGKQHQSQRIAFTRQRLQRWINGERATLWQDIPNDKPQRKSKSLSAEVDKALRHKRCDYFCREGADSKACKSLYAPALRP